MKHYIKRFLDDIKIYIDKLDWEEIAKATKSFHTVYENGGRVYLIGNGGSAAIASHFANDLNKTVFGQKGEKKLRRFQAIALSDNIPLLTAWANDLGYDYVFAEQLKNFAQSNDLLFAISSSGNSSNIIKAVDVAKSLGMTVVGMMGFDGGKLKDKADVKIFVPARRYEIVESIHVVITHLLTTYFYEILQ